MTQATDKASLTTLVTRARAGDGDAEQALYAGLLNVIRDLVWQVLARRGYRLPEGEREDLVQDLVIEAWQIDVPRFDEERGRLEDFLVSRVRWRVLDAVRRLSRRADREESLHYMEDPITWDTHPEVLREQAEEEGRLLLLPSATAASLKRMADKGRTGAKAVLGHDLAGQALCDLARRLKVHPSTVTRARHRALAHLARDLPSVLREAA